MSKTAIPKSTKQKVLKRDLGMCQIGYKNCTGIANGCDHRAGRGAGGSKVLNEPSNLIAACWSCNWQKETLHGVEREEMVLRGVIVPMSGTNERTAQVARETAFLHKIHGWVFLDDDGGHRDANMVEPV